MTSRRRFLAGVPALAALPPATPLRGVCDVAARRALVGRPGAFACPAPPPPLVDVVLDSYYTDRAYSVPDPAKLARYRQQTAALDGFSTGLARIADAWLTAEPARPQLAACGLAFMDAWASPGAMLGTLNDNGQHQRKWVLAGASLAFLKLRQTPQLDPAAVERVAAWLGRLSQASAAFYGAVRPETYNNHIWWWALATGATAVVGDDVPAFARAVALYRTALDTITPDGTLPAEMARGGRALIYHVTSLVPLVMLAELGAANGLDLYGERDGALHRLAARVRDGLADPAWFAARTGVPQDMGEGSTLAWTLTWAEPWYARFPDPALARLFVPFRPIFAPWLGGSPTHDFGSPHLPTP